MIVEVGHSLCLNPRCPEPPFHSPQRCCPEPPFHSPQLITSSACHCPEPPFHSPQPASLPWHSSMRRISTSASSSSFLAVSASCQSSSSPMMCSWSFHIGATVGRPSRYSAPMKWRCLVIESFGKCFVNKSAGLSSPLTLNKENSRLRSFSCTQILFTAICLWVPSPTLLQMPCAAAESVCTRRSTRIPKSPNNCWIPIPMPIPFTMA